MISDLWGLKKYKQLFTDKPYREEKPTLLQV